MMLAQILIGRYLIELVSPKPHSKSYGPHLLTFRLACGEGDNNDALVMCLLITIIMTFVSLGSQKRLFFWAGGRYRDRKN